MWAQVEGTPDSAGAPRVTAWSGRPAVALETDLAVPPGLLPGTYRVEMAPFAGSVMALGSVPVAAVSADQALDADGALVLPGVKPLSEQVLFGDSVNLAGYDLQRAGDELTLDLVWKAVQALPKGCQFFVHVVDAQDQIVSQFDGPLGRLAGGGQVSNLQAGQLVRERARLKLPPGTKGGAYRIYVGAYTLADGARLPLTGARRAGKRRTLSPAHPERQLARTQR